MKAGPPHWYSIYFQEGTSSQSFTGSSSLTASELSAQITSEQPVCLENLRYFGVVPGSGDVIQRWHTSSDPEENGAKVFIVPRHILYFLEHTADPLHQNTPSTGHAATAPEGAKRSDVLGSVTLQSTTAPNTSDDWMCGLWIAEPINIAGNKDEPSMSVMQLREDRTWAIAALWGTARQPAKASLSNHGDQWKLEALPGSTEFLGAINLSYGQPPFSLKLATGENSSILPGYMVRNDADHIEFHPYYITPGLTIIRYRRALPEERAAIERFLMPTPDTTTG